MKNYIEKHPFASVMMLAIVLRLVAVLFARGYMATDDQFETVDIAYRWLQIGIWDADGNMNWGPYSSGVISRFPLYNMLLYLNMKIMYWMGFEALDEIMYGVRLSHALFSLIGVAAVYRLVEVATNSKKWALIAGIATAAHFGLPYLSVRNLVEMFGGTMWAAALYYFYKHRFDGQLKWLIVAGVCSGLAWMFRFQIITAFWIVPFILWYEYKNLKPALYFSVSLIGMLILAGLIDWISMGTFMGTTINYVVQNVSVGAYYSSSPLLYTGVLLGFFIPPLSLILFYLAARKRFWQDHLLLAASTLSFFLVHTILANRQERFMIPIIPALVIILVLALRQHSQQNGFFFRWKTTRKGLIAFTIGLNCILLAPFTINYGQRELVEPLVRIEKMSDRQPLILFFTPDKSRIFPLNYSGWEMADRCYCFNWTDFQQQFAYDCTPPIIDYYLLYPMKSDRLQMYVDSLESRVGPLEQAFHIGPSVVDVILQAVNPGHRRAQQVWVYRNRGK